MIKNMANRRKRKREIQDEYNDLPDNITYLRHIGISEQKKRKVNQDGQAYVSSKHFTKQQQEQSPPDRTKRILLQGKCLKAYGRPPTKGASRVPLTRPRKISSTSSSSPMGLRRRDSLIRMRRPLLALQGSIRGKIAEQVRRSMMKGRQDYSLPLSATSGELDYLQFLTALQQRTGTCQDPLSDEDKYLQGQIDYEVKMRDGTAKLLAACKHPHQMLEAAKNLLTSNKRILAYMTALQQRKTDEVMKTNKNKDNHQQIPCRGTLSVSDIRVPLMWKDSDHFKNRGEIAKKNSKFRNRFLNYLFNDTKPLYIDHRRYAVFCVIQVGTNIQETCLLRNVDRTVTDLTFDSVITLENIGPDFECKLEVLCHKLHDDLSKASTPIKIKRRFNELSNSVGRSVGRRLSGLNHDPEFMADMLVGPKFECIANLKLKLAESSNDVSSHKLTLDACDDIDGGGCDLPLFDQLCCRLAVQPHCLTQVSASGYLFIKHEVRTGSRTKSGKFWCQLKNREICCWKNNDVTDAIPLMKIPFVKECEMSEVTRVRSQKSNCLSLTNRRSQNSKTYLLSAETADDYRIWWRALEQHLLDQAMWKHAAEMVMEIKSPPSTTATGAFFPKSGRLSLYEDTTVTDSNSPMTRILNRLQVAGMENNSNQTNLSKTQGLPRARLFDKCTAVSKKQITRSVEAVVEKATTSDLANIDPGLSLPKTVCSENECYITADNESMEATTSVITLVKQTSLGHTTTAANSDRVDDNTFSPSVDVAVTAVGASTSFIEITKSVSDQFKTTTSFSNLRTDVPHEMGTGYGLCNIGTTEPINRTRECSREYNSLENSKTDVIDTNQDKNNETEDILATRCGRLDTSGASFSGCTAIPITDQPSAIAYFNRVTAEQCDRPLNVNKSKTEETHQTVFTPICQTLKYTGKDSILDNLYEVSNNFTSDEHRGPEKSTDTKTKSNVDCNLNNQHKNNTASTVRKGIRMQCVTIVDKCDQNHATKIAKHSLEREAVIGEGESESDRESETGMQNTTLEGTVRVPSFVRFDVGQHNISQPGDMSIRELDGSLRLCKSPYPVTSERILSGNHHETIVCNNNLRNSNTSRPNPDLSHRISAASDLRNNSSTNSPDSIEACEENSAAIVESLIEVTGGSSRHLADVSGEFENKVERKFSRKETSV